MAFTNLILSGHNYSLLQMYCLGKTLFKVYLSNKRALLVYQVVWDGHYNWMLGLKGDTTLTLQGTASVLVLNSTLQSLTACQVFGMSTVRFVHWTLDQGCSG